MKNFQEEPNYFIHKYACINTENIGIGTRILAFTTIGVDVNIGDNVIIHPHVTIESGVTIGNGVEIFPGAYIGKEPKGAGATSRPLSFNRKILIHDNCSIGPNSVIYYDVEIGKNTLIGDNASIREQVKIGEFCILSRGVTVNYNTQIGNRTKIMDLTHITGNCQIGDDVFISVLVATTNDRAIGHLEYEEDRIQGPKISNKVAIGAGANILPNVHIGEGVIVAAASVVNKDIPAGKMVAGNPARVIKTVNE
jgi:UDP-3-O-[3-hydroxymyristoyl] glucosamine N-acyltransferase